MSLSKCVWRNCAGAGLSVALAGAALWCTFARRTGSHEPEKTSKRSNDPERTQSSDNESVPLMIITDPGQDLDDEMALVMLSALWNLGIVDPRCVVTNLHPSADRAVLARGTLDVLGLHHVPVGLGTDGGDTSAGALTLPAYAPVPKEAFVPGPELIRRTMEAAQDGSLTLLLISSIKDAAHIVQTDEELFARKVGRVVIMGGKLPQASPGETLKPDSAHNNQFDKRAAELFYERVQQLKIPLVVLSRFVAYKCPVPRTVFEDLAQCGSPVGEHLRDRQQKSIEGLWCRAAGGDRKGLPDRCDKTWFGKTFCGGAEEVQLRSERDSIWDLVDRFQMYDTFALLACIPSLGSLFSPVRYEVLGAEHRVIGDSAEQPGMTQEQADRCAQLLKAGYLAGAMPKGQRKSEAVEAFKLIVSRG